MGPNDISPKIDVLYKFIQLYSIFILDYSSFESQEGP